MNIGNDCRLQVELQEGIEKEKIIKIKGRYLMKRI